MISTTRGIVIRYLKYRETSIIVHIFTEKFGMGSFIVNGIRSTRSKRSIGYFQPFSLLEVVCHSKPNREIQHLSDFKYFAPAHSIQTDIRKSTIALFLAEVIGKLLNQEQGNPQQGLFDFLTESILRFDGIKAGIENFHLHFLLKILPFIGLGIDDGDALIESMEMEMMEDDKRVIEFISEIIRSDLETSLMSNGNLRFKTLELILQYYHHHTDVIGEIKSLKVLHQVFS